MLCVTFFQVLLSLVALRGVLSAPLPTPVIPDVLPTLLPVPRPSSLEHLSSSQPFGALPSSVMGPPWFVIYADQDTADGAPIPDDIRGFNVLALSFLMSNKTMDKVKIWENMKPTDRTSMINQYHLRGIKVVVSLFGATDKPSADGTDPVAFAARVAKWVKDNGVDGVDVDYEDLDAFNRGDGTGEQFVIALTKALRQELPVGQYIVSHSPQAPWFSYSFRGGGYSRVHREVGDMIDFYSIQYYNQGRYEPYADCDSLLYRSNFPGSSILEMMRAGIPGSKLVIGKPATPANANDGYMPPATIAECAGIAKNQGWNGGIMTWQYPDANTTWITTARGTTFPFL